MRSWKWRSRGCEDLIVEDESSGYADVIEGSYMTELNDGFFVIVIGIECGMSVIAASLSSCAVDVFSSPKT